IMECNSSDVQMSHCAEGSETTIETKIKTLDSQTYNLHVNKCIRSSNQGEVGVCKYTVGGYICEMDARVMWDNKTGHSRGYGFVLFCSQQALDRFNTAVVSPIYYVMFTLLCLFLIRKSSIWHLLQSGDDPYVA
uniref:RRM domain-containing protein n=4 Tax=Aegilops tauschii subsp. strangulata TaxID=200361 RepID=A0A453RFG6_AEGTS